MRMRISPLGLVALAFASALTACDRGTITDPDLDDPVDTPVLASAWIDFVNWDERTIVNVSMVENGSQLSYSPNTYTFEAGKPYVLRITNSAFNESKHYFSPSGLESFFKAVATRKVQTPAAEYKAPYFDAVELKIGGVLEIYFVPVLAGEYGIVCTIPGHQSAGMTASVTITGGEGYRLDLEVAPDFNTALATDARKSGSHEVWASAVERTVGMVEGASTFTFDRGDFDLSVGVAYKLTLDNPASNASKHYYTAGKLYRTVVLLKAEDANAEIKAPYLNAVELLVGGSTTLFMVPTEVGSFDVVCTIAGHREAGMTGSITVVDPSATPVTASDWVDFVNWDERTTIDVSMVEDGGKLSYSPNTFTFEAGKPYVLRISNPASNESKHYFSPSGFESFFQAVATRKIQTVEAEYKAPYFDAVELKIGGTLEIYFVPVLKGEYDIVCTIAGHEAAGMTGSVEILWGDGYQLDLEVSPEFDAALTTDARRSGSHAVWTTALDVTVGMAEGDGTYSFVPPTLEFTKGLGYRLKLDNPAGNSSKHYYTAPELYRTVVLRKADDDQAEIKAPYLKAVELLIGGSTTLFIVPTEVGSFDVSCTIGLHSELGMVGNLTVGTGP